MSSHMYMDELDLALVKELERDARQSTRSLAAKLGTTSATVSARIRRLTNAKALTFVTLTEPMALGLQVRAVIGLNISAERPVDIGQNLLCHRSVQYINLLTGRYDVMIYAVFRTVEEVINFVSDELGQVEGVTTIDKMIILQVTKSSWNYFSDRTMLREERVIRHLDMTETKLVEQLELSPRDSVNSLGKKIGLSRQLTARKLQKLLDEKLVRVVSVISPGKFGFGVHVLVFVRVHPTRIRPVVQALAADSRSRFVMIITGHFDILIHFSFRDMEEMAHFVTNEIRLIPGIVEYETMIEVGRLKTSFHMAGSSRIFE